MKYPHLDQEFRGQVRELAAADQEIASLKREREVLLRDLALAECQIERQQRQLIAAGVLDPEVRP